MPIVLDPTWTQAPNPRLWLDMATLGSDDPSYAVGVAPPEGDAEWIDYSQFCSVLAADWLAPGRRAAWGLSNYGEDGAIAAAKQLLAFQAGGMAAQVTYAETALNALALPDLAPAATSDDTDAVANAPVGTVIWAGSDAHAVSAYVEKADSVRLYDPDGGTAATHSRAEFRQMLGVLELRSFVLRQPS